MNRNVIWSVGLYHRGLLRLLGSTDCTKPGEWRTVSGEGEDIREVGDIRGGG